MFLKSKIFGLDISDNSIEVMLLSKAFGKTKVVSYGRKVLRGEIVKDGIIKNPDKLGQKISQVLEEAKPKPIKAKQCIVSLPESKIFSHVFYFPANLNHEQIKKSLPYEAEKIIPFSSDEVYFDFKIINKDKKSQEVFYAATYPQVVEGYLGVLNKIGLEVVAFDLESISLARALIKKEEKNQGIMIMDIGARSTNLNIFDRQGLRASTIINIAGNRFRKTIAKELNITEEEAEEFKASAGFDTNKDQGKLIFILQKEFRRIIKETKDIIEYFSSRQKRAVKKIILAGGSSLIPKIAEYLSENIGLEVSLADPFVNIKVPKDFSQRRKGVLYATVVGLALRGINKNPKTCDVDLIAIKTKKFEIIPQKQEKRLWKRIYISAVVFIILIVIFGLLFFGRQKGIDTFQIFFKAESEPLTRIEISDEELEKVRQKSLEEVVATSTPDTTTTTTEVVETPTSTQKVLILDTPTGFLNVRTGPGLNFEKITTISPGDEYILVEEENDWYKIELEGEQEAWIYSIYAEKF